MLLALGDDPYALPLEASLADAGVFMHTVRCADLATGTAFICVSDDAENAITVTPGANMALAAEHLPELHGISHLLMQLETPMDAVASYARAARAAGAKVVLNAAPARSLPANMLDWIDILIVNEGELAQIAGQSGRIADQLQRLKVPAVVVTLGARGCCALVGNQYLVQPAFSVEPVDTTGAGDTFCGVLVAALDQGDSMAKAMRLASAASALACTQPGAQSAIPARSAVNTLLDSQADAPAAHAALRQFCGLPD
jgi:ribokinase